MTTFVPGINPRPTLTASFSAASLAAEVLPFPKCRRLGKEKRRTSGAKALSKSIFFCGTAEAVPFVKGLFSPQKG
jgi:hypothetical protein